MPLLIETTTVTRCSECKQELLGPNHWVLHRRQHMLERLTSTQEGRRIYGMLTQCGFSDQPDRWLTEAVKKEREDATGH